MTTRPVVFEIIDFVSDVVSVFSTALDDTIKIQHNCINRLIIITFDALSAINIFPFSSLVILWWNFFRCFGKVFEKR